MMFPMLRRLICELIGHSWQDPWSIGEWPGPVVPIIEDHGLTMIGVAPITYLYRSTCNRCHAAVEGDWDAMEAVGAWRHYRSW